MSTRTRHVLVFDHIGGRALPTNSDEAGFANKDKIIDPVAVGGSDRTVGVGQTITPDGSGSSEQSGDKITSAWELITAPRGDSRHILEIGSPVDQARRARLRDASWLECFEDGARA